jgi:hypothetical protein
MKWFSKKRLTSLILAVMMTVSAIALCAYAMTPEVPVEDGDGYAPGTNAQFWYSDAGLSAEFAQRLIISGVAETRPLGRNTIQEYIHINNGNDDFYAITTHPQYFGTAYPYDYDDQIYAKYVLEITGLYVWDDEENGYVDCFETGFGIIPTEYAIELPTATDPGYFQVEVYAKIINLDTGAVFNADWNGAVAYLEIPAGL